MVFEKSKRRIDSAWRFRRCSGPEMRRASHQISGTLNKMMSAVMLSELLRSLNAVASNSRSGIATTR